MSTVLLAVNWEFELRGVLTVIIGVAVLMGSVYLILGTNLGARLGFLVAFTALAGWMALMGGVWWMYGIGLKGAAPEWKQVPGRTVIQEVDLLDDAGVLDRPIDFTEQDDSVAAAQALDVQLEAEGWRKVAESAPEFGQAEAAAGVFLEEEDALSPGDFDVTNVYEVGGEAYPKPLGDELDLIAFWHKPYYTLVEVAPFEPLRDEPGRAPTAPEIDTSMQRQYVYMVRDLGSLREPAAYICLGSSVVFLALCWVLHRRDRFVAENLSRKALASA
jgi:predicted transcriptional regulator